MSDYRPPEWDERSPDDYLYEPAASAAPPSDDDPFFKMPDADAFFAPPSDDLTAAPQPERSEAASAPAPQDDFQPDFGNAFDDYGDYEAQPQPARPQTRSTVRKRRHLKKFKFPLLLKLAIYIAVVILAGVLLANLAWDLADDVLALSRPDLEIEVRIEENDTLDDITETLKSAGVIKYDWLFKEFCRIKDCEDDFDPGVYTINLNFDYNALVNGLQAGSGTRETVTIMIPEGSTCDRIFTLLDEQGVCSRSALEQCAAEYHFDDYSFLNGLPYGDPNRLEGYLFPDTYEFYLKDDPERVLGKMLRNFDNKMDEDMMELVNGSGLTLHEVVTMASIIEGEAANDSERGLVASVMFNRMQNWDYPLLGMDSTVNYGARLLGVDFSKDLDSPYNTYLYPGLPVGPINNPGMSSIRAVLYPEESGYYYFATGKDGVNHFFTNEADHNAFVESDEYAGN